MMDMSGQTIGNYRIETLLGSGGMGQVFRATHVHLPRTVAIKVLHAQYASEPTFQARFLQEAQAAAALDHPNIVEIIDFGEANGRLYLVMELVEGGSVRTMLQQQPGGGQPLPLPLGVDFVRQAAEGLAYAHAQQMVHRDIKPDNLLLRQAPGTASGQQLYTVKITDFGLARLAEGGVTTTHGLTMGTPAYISPEQAQALPLDGRSDLYSLGVVLYEVSTGYLPFQTKGLSDAVFKHVYTEPPPPSQVRPDLPPRLEAIILRCLSKKPDDRYATGTDLATELNALLADLGSVPPVVVPEQSPAFMTQTEEQGIQLAIEQDRLIIVPGEPTIMRAMLSNISSTIDQIEVVVDGVPSAWVSGPAGPVQVAPGAQMPVLLSIVVPRTGEGKAGDYEVTIRARSRNHPNVERTAAAVWTIQPFGAASMTITPATATARTKADYRIVIDNQGNQQASCDFRGEDEGQTLSYSFRPAAVNVEPGQQATVTATVGHGARWSGGEQSKNFTIWATFSGLPPQSVNAEFVQRVFMPIWVPVVLAVMLLGCVGGGALLYAGLLPFVGDDDPTPTPEPTIIIAGGTATPSPATATQQPTVVQTVIVETAVATPVPTPAETATPTEVVVETPAPTIPRLAFTTGRGSPPGILEIYLINGDGSGLQRVTNNDQDDWAPAWSPDGSQIAFISTRDGNNEIYVMNNDGSDQRRLTNSPDSDEIPIWSPNAPEIAFTRLINGRPDIFIINSDGTGLQNLTNTPNASDWGTTWAPDGQQIVFVTDRDGDRDIYIMNVDGSDQRPLTTVPAHDDSPEWSRDGQRIAFVSERDGNREVYVMNADGSNQTRLTTTNQSEFDPAWSPDNSKIAFVSERDGVREIYVMNADGSGQTRLTVDGGYESWIGWSPDGRQISWISDRDGERELYVINANGTGMLRLSENPTFDGNPEWDPVTMP